jgi:hypothetical protein
MTNSRVADESTIGLHFGNVLIQRVANTYDTLLKVILEQVQNALDAGAKKIEIILNKKNHQLIVRDNGKGVSETVFRGALKHVCCTIKDETKLGRFGIGVVSPLGKCIRFTFTSCPEPEQNNFREWIFVTKDIEGQIDEPKVPSRFCPHLTMDVCTAGLERVWWRTEVKMFGITTDRVLGKVTMNSLVENVTAMFGPTMRRLKTRVEAEIVDESGDKDGKSFTALSFTGSKLKEREIFETQCGKTIFRLYVARKKDRGRKGKVLMGEIGDDFRFPFTDFVRSAAGEFLSPEVVDALRLGLFEGEILSEKARLHASRRRFETDEALQALCITIEAWFERYGKKHLSEANDNREAERFQDLGLRSLRSLEKLLQDSRFDQFKEAIKSFRVGTVGTGHTEVPGINGEEDEPTLAIRGGGGKSKLEASGKTSNKKHNPPRKDPEEEKEGQVPLTSAGPLGRHRKTIRSNSLGLEFRHERMEGSDDLWKFDDARGIITFNIRHPIWVECAEKDRTVMALQEFIALQAFGLLIMPPDWRDIVKTGYDELVAPFAFLAKVGAFGNRAPSA